MTTRELADRHEDPTLQAATAEFAAQVNRTASWLNSLPHDRIERGTDRPSIAADAHRIAAGFLRLQLELEPDSYPTSPAPHLPSVRPHATGAQLSVLGTELIKTAQAADSSSRGLAEQLAGFARELIALRNR